MDTSSVLARRYRPRQFHQVIGQTAVVQMLSNAITRNKLHHAYVLSGCRGIGKTSLARLFAKGIRCQDRTVKENLVVCCEKCSDCLQIQAFGHLDVSEIDGASYNGVDAIRDLRDQVQFLPKSGTKKIIIIDEVHMLTNAAFNALLKVLEEPPLHILFIFATTEPHKIPDTILSRCQRFDLKRFTSQQIIQALTTVLQNDSIDFEKPALAAIAQAAAGSMRDALSFTNQVLSFCSDKVSLDAVTQSLSLIQEATLLQMLEGILTQNPLMALQALDAVFDAGYDLSVCLDQLLELIYTHHLFVLDLTNTHETLSQAALQKLQSLKTLRSAHEIAFCFQALFEIHHAVCTSQHAKRIFDMALIKCSQAIARTEQILPNLQKSEEKPKKPEVSFEGFCEFLTHRNAYLQAVLSNCTHATLPTSPQYILTLTFSHGSAFLEQLNMPENTRNLTLLAKEYFDCPDCTINLAQPQKTSLEVPYFEKKAKVQEQQMQQEQQIQQEKLLSHPLIQEAIGLFDVKPSELNLKAI